LSIMLKAMEMALKASWIEPDVLEGGKSMSEIRVKENESLESALRRFKRSCAKEGVIAEVKRALREPQPEAEAEV
jgi:small subunit ribosomal protein S21